MLHAQCTLNNGQRVIQQKCEVGRKIRNGSKAMGMRIAGRVSVPRSEFLMNVFVLLAHMRPYVCVSGYVHVALYKK